VADITPPVCLAAYAGAGIAGSEPMRTGGTAVKIAIAAFIVPFIFVTNPVLLLQGATVWNLVPALATAVLGMTVISASMMGYFLAPSNAVERILLLGAGVLLIYPSLPLSLAGLGLAVALGVYQYLRKRTGRGDTQTQSDDTGYDPV
jgi:TRAP-type uncharacterized transport system fused permease subunit